MTDQISNLPDIIFLCGFMGAGKSTIGKELAARLNLPFADLDEIIEQSVGLSIPDIFEGEGEKGFRRYEKDALLKTIREYEGVLSLGGGALHNQHIVDHVKLNGLLIFIQTPFSVILNRVLAHKNRPLLLDEEGNMKEKPVLKEELKERYEKRLKYYRQAEITIQTGSESAIDDTIQKLIQKIKNHVSHY